ncbi:DUF2922 domain-containing protein [Candidatus Enterococcus ferrettii]|uniref:DUF2922 family protein n=1 Tax=Candidatus Enterococcus ferrettii TaxID=2815324 RepID=A0ABV0ESE2_9ENTE|nr:DUF2922 domain-containing protein [Enterococcus sp. 665A]MBO1341367.1 DUF2922 domain-containing protein [Enterococcus sp. 665A]
MFKLAAVFENAAGRTHRWGYNDPDPTKSPEEIKTALETITTLNLFQKDGIRQFTKVVSAKFVETIETPIFDLSKPTPEAYVADPNNIFSAHIVAEEAPQVSVTPAVNEEEITIEAVAQEEVVTSKAVKAAVPATKMVNPLEQKFNASATSVKPEALAAIAEKTKKTNLISSNSAQQLEALTNESVSPTTDSLTVHKPVNSRKAQVDRVRAFHETKKKKGKKKKR